MGKSGFQSYQCPGLKKQIKRLQSTQTNKQQSMAPSQEKMHGRNQSRRPESEISQQC